MSAASSSHQDPPGTDSPPSLGSQSIVLKNTPEHSQCCNIWCCSSCTLLIMDTPFFIVCKGKNTDKDKKETQIFYCCIKVSSLCGEGYFQSYLREKECTVQACCHIDHVLNNMQSIKKDRCPFLLCVSTDYISCLQALFGCDAFPQQQILRPFILVS